MTPISEPKSQCLGVEGTRGPKVCTNVVEFIRKNATDLKGEVRDPSEDKLLRVSLPPLVPIQLGVQRNEGRKRGKSPTHFANGVRHQTHPVVLVLLR